MSSLSFVRRRPTLLSLVLREFQRPKRPSLDFSEVRRRSQLKARARQMSLRARTDPVSRLQQELARYEGEEFRLEQVMALRQIQHLLPLVEAELPRLDAKRAARAARVLEDARDLPDPEELRRRPVYWWLTREQQPGRR